MVSIEGTQVKETTLTFVLIPIIPGLRQIEPASILDFGGEIVFKQGRDIVSSGPMCLFE